MTCPDCGTEWGPATLSCPSCLRLVHAERLKELARRAGEAEAEGRNEDALSAWQSALVLLPPHAKQRQTILQRAEQMLSRIGQQSADKPKETPAWAKSLGFAAPVILLLLTKGKWLLLGLTKLPTLLSMFAALGVYWTLWGWQFALGFLLSIYIHEMGHVYELQRRGIAATVPLFIPGFGAVIFSRQRITLPSDDARIGLAGPLWGLGAALACWGLFAVTGNALFAALRHIGALVNLFNLLPVWSLDGSRGMRGLSRPLRLALAVIAIATAIFTGNIFAWLIAGLLLIRLFAVRGQEPAVTQPDWLAFALFAGLIVSLAWIADIPGPVEPGAFKS